VSTVGTVPGRARVRPGPARRRLTRSAQLPPPAVLVGLAGVQLLILLLALVVRLAS
jgi:hypothetical protein